jgi:hypothetical protein
MGIRSRCWQIAHLVKLKKTHAIEHSPCKHLSDELKAKIREIEEKLGYQRGETKVLFPADENKPN